MTLRFSPNLSLLWADLPLPERFARAAAAGFGAVELWWPGDEDAKLLPGLAERWGLHLALLNFDAGDMPAGDRGLAADPDRTAQLRANVPLALRIAADCACPRLNLLVGLRDRRYPLDQQLALAHGNVAWAADQAAAAGQQVLIEAVLISHIQIADVPGRGEPGTGEINYRFLLDYLGHRGYDGYVGLEYRPSGGSPEESFGWLDDFGLARGSGS